MSFPTDFTWGVAAASYQIEGAWKTARDFLYGTSSFVSRAEFGKGTVAASPATIIIATRKTSRLCGKSA
jgi:beta-glucosidase/6-phospho-beta-glucosidase/beta-galactosidase